MIGARFGFMLACLLPGAVAAQRGDSFSIVGALLGVEFGGRDLSSALGGIGYDVQVRFAASGSRSSVGAGVYRTANWWGTAAEGTFVELRVALGEDSPSVTPYVTARLSNLRRGFFQGAGAALGAGAGAVLALAPKLQLDGSATFAHVWLPASTTSLSGNGVSLTLRIGAAVRLG